ncbi:hypothetical protein [Isoptericola haloaureus]|uniref:Uncharacterized protein n=1 Tax=Isoptericola haloaureus TaxID=1542902 RepID=A0ABU7Z5F5_9MICO
MSIDASSEPVSPRSAAVTDLLAAPVTESVRARADRQVWARWLDGIDGAEAGLEVLPRELDRAQMCRLAEMLLGSDQVVGAFVVTMVWGHGDTGYGPFRTRQALTGQEKPQGFALSTGVVERLTESVAIARRNGPVEGFRYLANDSRGRIKHLGPAFFTKWLYAATARGVHDREGAAPVLDDRVLTWVNSHTDLALRPWRTDDYAAYIEALTAWGANAQPSRTAVGVEGAIFAATAKE